MDEMVNEDESKFPTQFRGNMNSAMASLQTLSLVLVILSSVFVWWTKNEVIFP